MLLMYTQPFQYLIPQQKYACGQCGKSIRTSIEEIATSELGAAALQVAKEVAEKVNITTIRIYTLVWITCLQATSFSNSLQ